MTGLVVSLLVMAGTGPTAAQPIVSLGGVIAGYLEIRTQAQHSHEKVLAAAATHADLSTAAADAAAARQSAEVQWREQVGRYGRVIADALRATMVNPMRTSSRHDGNHEDMIAVVDLVSDTGRAFQTAVTALDAAEQAAVVATRSLDIAAAEVNRLRDELAGRLTTWRSALDQLTADEREMLGVEAASRPDIAVPPGASARQVAGSGGLRVFAPTQGIVTSGFGSRWGAMHYGLDIANRIGTPVRSVMDGVVVEAGHASGFGLWVKIEHTIGTTAVYGHVDSIAVRARQQIVAGQVIATMGNRGESTGPHLHFEIWDWSGRKLDPLNWLHSNGIMVW